MRPEVEQMTVRMCLKTRQSSNLINPGRDGLHGDGLRAPNNCSWRETSTPLFNYLVRWTWPEMGKDQKAIMARQITTREKYIWGCIAVLWGGRWGREGRCREGTCECSLRGRTVSCIPPSHVILPLFPSLLSPSLWLRPLLSFKLLQKWRRLWYS